MLHICHITSVHPRYDVRIYHKECRSLVQDGYLVSLIVADGLKDEIRDGINIYDVGKARNRVNRIFITTNKILNQVLTLKPKIVIFHDPELMKVGNKLLKYGFKVIYDVHEDVPKQVLNKEWLPKLVRPFLSRIVEGREKKYAKNFNGIMCATEFIQNRFKQYNLNSITLFNYPILVSSQEATDISWENKEDKICYIGSISKARGIIPLLESLQLSKITLELAGIVSNPGLLEELSILPSMKYVNYLGVLSPKDIASLLARVKIGIVTLLPTPSYIESLPIKLFEYMRAGIPVVASNFPLWKEIIEKYECGLLVNPENPEEIAKACLWLLNNPKCAWQMGQNGRKAVYSYFSWESQSTKLVNLISSSIYL